MKAKRKAGKGKLAALITGAVVLTAAVGFGAWYYMGHNSSEPVYVYSFDYVGMTEYWGDSQESNGPVSTDKIQTVFLSDTQTVTEVLVEEGDTVRKGDLLMRFDTTLSDLKLERKRLDVEKLKLQLEKANQELARIRNMRPMVIPDYSDTEEDDDSLGEKLEPGEYRIYPEDIGDNSMQYDGYSQERALICWINSDRGIDHGVFEELRQRAKLFQEDNLANAEPEASEPADEPGDEDGTDATDADTPPEAGEDPPQVPTQVVVNTYHVVFRITENNRKLGAKVFWQGMVVSRVDGQYQFRLTEAVVPDYALSEEEESSAQDKYQIDFGSGYTAAQIAEMRVQQEKKIKDLEFQVKMAESEYKIMQIEMEAGEIYADIDGKVISCISEEEAKQTRQPMLKVSGGGGFYVEGFISELEKDKMRLNQQVTVNDWSTGTSYTGVVHSIGEFPTRNGYYNGNGNPNVSYYPFNVFVDESANLQAGSYVSVAYSAAESENGIYLENPFIRTEQGKHYVYVMDAEGKLEQRYVTTGKSLWGSYTQILSGLTADDLVAFPYGKNVKPGAPAVEGDLGNLYS